ncbi:uncharacterized protein LOC122335121 [Puntigrus tetrazona]|uniref:uncharacterized protein LOC122335121 n=1 Tax=Puntigrus tetrazona TaxID=1606681 RepID=UPI001C89BAC5|nr:uncharacterized protein LOC122335121 [Puntigrus tetrazona]
MMALFVLLILLMNNTGLCAEISVFVKTGALVQLDVQTQEPEFTILFWSNEKSQNIITYLKETKSVTPNDIYKDRVVFNKTSFSLTLKNMQKKDSGLYRARTSGQSENILVIYRVSVLDEVEDPVLTVNSSWSSPQPCSFTCNGSNSFFSSVFNANSCSPEEVTSADNHTLKLSCSEDSITCNYSNLVSSKTVVKKVYELCAPKQGKYEEASAFTHWSIASVCLPILALVAVISFIFFYYIYKRKKGAQGPEQTVYAHPFDENVKPQNPLEMLEKSEKPSTVYDTVRDAGQTDDTNHITANDDPMNQVKIK